MRGEQQLLLMARRVLALARASLRCALAHASKLSLSFSKICDTTMGRISFPSLAFIHISILSHKNAKNEDSVIGGFLAHPLPVESIGLGNSLSCLKQ